MHCPQGGGWICVPPPSQVLNLAVREKEVMRVAGLVTTTLGVAIGTTGHRCRPSMMEVIVLVIIAAIFTAHNIHVMTSNATGGGGEDDAMSHFLHAACNLCNVAVVAEIACNKCNIAAMLQRLQQCRKECSDVAFVACNCSNVAFVACDKCNIAVIANLKACDCPSS